MSETNPATVSDCEEAVHLKAIEGMELFNHGQYFEAHEALEAAWRGEKGPIRELYRGILQVGVVYLHITRGNQAGAIKVYQRCRKWLEPWPETCRGIPVGEIRRDLENVMSEVQRLGPQHIGEFDRRLLKPIQFKTSIQHK